MSHEKNYAIQLSYLEHIYLDGETVLNALKQVFYDPPIEPCDCEPQTDLLELPYSQNDNHPRRTSGASSVSGKKLHSIQCNAMRIYLVFLLVVSNLSCSRLIEMTVC